MTSAGRYAGRSVLVTGGQGFIGSWLVERLLEEGAVVVVPRRDVPSISRFRMAGLEERCELVQADVTDYEGVLRLIHEYAVAEVFHLAAQTIVGTANRSPLSTYESNVRGTYTLLEACRTAEGVGSPVERIVVASSDKAYGAHDALPYREASPLQPAFPYDVSKACTDMIARSYALAHGLPVAVTRFGNVYGAGDLNFSRVVPDTARALVRDRQPVLRSDGSPVREYLHVDDAVEAYLTIAASLARSELHGRAWNAGGGEPVAVIEVVRRLISISGRDVEPELEGSGSPAGEIGDQHLDSTALREELGWTPSVALDRGLEDAYAWYRRVLSNGDAGTLDP